MTGHLIGASCLLAVFCVFVSPIVAPTADQDKIALRDFWISTGGPNWREGYNWIDPLNKDPCDDFDSFRGVSCTGELSDADRRIQALTLSFLQLSGFINSTFGDMTELQTVYLSQNSIGGTLPVEICSLTKLQHLDLWKNQLEGQLPECIGNMTAMQHLDVRSNKLTGVLPPSMANLGNIKALYLSSNKFSGPIPEFLGNLKTLDTLFLSYNKFAGTVPATLAARKCVNRFEWMDLRGNAISGELPEVVTLLQSL